LSRNKDRLGGTTVPQDNSVPPQVIQQAAQDEGNAFSFVIPTEFVELPSGGKFYPPHHPLHNAESIEIRQMTAKEEDILTSQTLLKKGIAIDRVIKNIIVNKKIDPDSLLVGDRNAIIIATRVSGYGNEYSTKVGCPQCGATTEYTFDLNQARIYHGEDADSLDIVNNEDGTFEVVLPRTKLTITFKLLNGRDEKVLLTGVERDRKQKITEKTITRSLHNMMVAINGDPSPEAINYLIANIPSIDARHLRHAYRLAAPNIDLSQDFECNECGHEQTMEVPLNAEFFWPDR
tara:strand:- start:1788 stop:2657 length:870 start_codon:yes stop_codon:yes gene_type:complete